MDLFGKHGRGGCS